MRTIPYKVLCSIGAILTAIALALVINSPATGYEYSIYTSTPLAVWVLILTSVLISITLLLSEASKGNHGRRWVIALLILMGNSIVVILISTLRDYYSVGSDTLMHMGYVMDLANGIISDQNIYPGVHVIPAFLVKIGLSPALSTNISPAFIYVIYVASFYGLSRFIWSNRCKVIIATTISALLLLPHGIGLSATLVGAAIFPLTLLAIMRLKRDFNKRNIVIFAFLLVAISFIHPLALEVAIICVVVACVLPEKNRMKFIVLTIIIFPIAVWWYEGWYGMNVVFVFFKDLLDSIVASAPSLAPSVGPSTGLPPGVAPPVDSAGASFLPSMEGIKATQTTDYSGVSLIIRRYGSEILAGLLAIVSFMLILRKSLKRISQNRWYLYICSLFVLLNIMWVMGWYLQMGIYDLALSRMLNWVPTVSIVLITPLIFKLLGCQSLRRVAFVVVVLFLLSLQITAVFNIYRSPISGNANSQITRQHMDGVNWLLEYGNPKVPIVHLNSQRVSRRIAAIKGVEWVRNHQKDYWLHEYRLQTLFSYNDKPSMGLDYAEDVYVIVTKFDRLLPRWQKDKLFLIETDSATTLIYKDNSEYEVWYVESSLN